jgi:SAM-dependent methyltransferase
VIDPAIESHYGTGYERSRLFPGGNPSLEFVRSMELLDRLLPGPPARLLDVGGGPGTYAAPLASRGYRVHLADPVPLHVEQARQAAGRDLASGFTAALGDARELPQRAEHLRLQPRPQQRQQGRWCRLLHILHDTLHDAEIKALCPGRTAPLRPSHRLGCSLVGA